MQFNETKDTVAERTEATNYEGGQAFEPDTPKLGLYKLVINNLLEDTYYREDTEALAQVKATFEAAAEVDPEYPLKLAAYAREEMYLRDISQVLLVLAANHDEAKAHVRRYAPAIMQRADEPATVVAIHKQVFGGTLPKPLKKGINDALHHFDAYQFAKYNSSRREVNLRDVLNLTHPKPADDEHAEIFERLIKGPLDEYPEVDDLEPPETWEVVISERGNTAEAWREVRERMGLFATLRNLRNMVEAGLDGEEIVDADDLEHVSESKIYPFRFYQAYKALKAANIRDEHLERWLSDAVDASIGNLPDDLSETVVAVDLSGSMQSRLSPNSNLEYIDIASFFGAVLMRMGAATTAFASDFAVLDAHVDTPALQLTDQIRGVNVGGSTNGWKAIDWLHENNLKPERVIMLTDMQIWDSTRGFGRSGNSVKRSFDAYREQVNLETALYMVDLSSYGQLVTPEGYPQVYNISGWNEKIIDFIQYAERPGDIVREVDAYEPV